MAALPDFYKALGVGETASADEIKKAYRRLAREHHPDRNAGDPRAEERFKEIQQAYEVLSNPQKRAEYDKMRRDPFAARGAPPGGGRFYRTPDGTYVRVESTGFGPEGGFSFTDEGFGFGDLFERFFAGAAGAPPGRGPARAAEPETAGADLEATVELSFEEALTGGKKTLRTPDGQSVRVTIPQGVEDGTRVRLRGRGRAGPRGRRGDLYITFRVRPSARFTREGLDLVTRETINVAEAMLGTTRTVSNAYGDQIRVKIPAGTQPDERLRLRGQGVRSQEGTGDLLVEIRVTIPRHLSAEARERVRAWAQQAGLISGEAAADAA